MYLLTSAVWLFVPLLSVMFTSVSNGLGCCESVRSTRRTGLLNAGSVSVSILYLLSHAELGYGALLEGSWITTRGYREIICIVGTLSPRTTWNQVEALELSLFWLT